MPSPTYYRWNQWFFLKFLENGLAYRQMAPVDWCPKDQVVLAREQVEGADRVCWRCGTPVIKRDLEQWFFRTTKYADEYLSTTASTFPSRSASCRRTGSAGQKGAEVVFATESGDALPVFTTRPDTLFGATFMVLAPEHPLVGKLTTTDSESRCRRLPGGHSTEVRDRPTVNRPREDGCSDRRFTRSTRSTASEIPIWIADYVLSGYGTGAIMAVPAHDERDFAFAQKFGLPIRQVVAPQSVAEGAG